MIYFMLRGMEDNRSSNCASMIETVGVTELFLKCLTCQLYFKIAIGFFFFTKF